MCGEGIAADNNMSYSEYISKNSEHNFKDGYKLMEAFI
jgi:hypothetical protein